MDSRTVGNRATLKPSQGPRGNQTEFDGNNERSLAVPNDGNESNNFMQRLMNENNNLISSYFKELTSKEINDTTEYVIDSLDKINCKQGTEIIEQIMENELNDELQNISYSEYYIRNKHRLKNFAPYDDNSKQSNPFEFNAFESINKLATVLNYDIYAVSELKQKDNPFQNMKKDISVEIKEFSKELEALIKENRNSIRDLRLTATK